MNTQLELEEIQNAIGWANEWSTVATGAALLCRYIAKLEKRIEVLEARERLRAEAWNAKLVAIGGEMYQEVTRE